MSARRVLQKPAAELRELMAEHGLVQREVAELAGVSAKTVEGWLATPGCASAREMAPRNLTLIRALLPDFLAARPKKG